MNIDDLYGIPRVLLHKTRIWFNHIKKKTKTIIIHVGEAIENNP